MRGSQSGRRAEDRQRLRFEEALADVCTQFINISPNEIDSKVENAQRVICEALSVNHSSVWQVSEDDPCLCTMTHAYRDSRLDPLPSNPTGRAYFPWCQSKILSNQIVCVPDTANLPEAATTDMSSWRQYGIQSSLIFPLSTGGNPVIGALAFDSTELRDWPELLQRRLQILAHVFAHALHHKYSHRRVHRMEEALSDMGRRLIESQEEERARIGRELHDDIGQRLALLTVELSQLEENFPEVQSRVQELRKQTTEISNDVQALSHELHCSKLEYLGVVSGIKGWCKEFAEWQKIKINFTSDVSSTVPFEVGLCLFRVLQEAVHNATKHSGAKRIEVQLTEHLNEVHLSVGDSGVGFNLEAAKQRRGLGLTSMQERVRLANGTIEIQSKPDFGTTIRVRLPFRSEQTFGRAAG